MFAVGLEPYVVGKEESSGCYIMRAYECVDFRSHKTDAIGNGVVGDDTCSTWGQEMQLSGA